MVDAKSAREPGAEVWPRPAREAGGRGKPMAQAVGIGCERSASPRSGRKTRVRSGDFSVAKSVVSGAKGTRCRPSALPMDTQRPGLSPFARFAGFIPLTTCFPRLAPWAFLFRPLRGLLRTLKTRPRKVGRASVREGWTDCPSIPAMLDRVHPRWVMRAIAGPASRRCWQFRSDTEPTARQTRPPHPRESAR